MYPSQSTRLGVQAHLSGQEPPSTPQSVIHSAGQTHRLIIAVAVIQQNVTSAIAAKPAAAAVIEKPSGQFEIMAKTHLRNLKQDAQIECRAPECRK